jgi:hypothetical protein
VGDYTAASRDITACRKDWLGRPGQGCRPELFEVVPTSGELPCPPGDHDLTGGGDPEQPGGETGRISGCRVVGPQRGSNGADHHGSGVEGDADPKLQPMTLSHLTSYRLEAVLQSEGGAQSPAGMVIVARVLAEERHDSVAQELVHGATMVVNRVQDDGERFVHDLADLLGIEPLGKRRVAGDVRKEYRHLLALAPVAQRGAA